MKIRPVGAELSHAGGQANMWLRTLGLGFEGLKFHSDILIMDQYLLNL